MAEMYSSARIHWYTLQLFGFTQEGEEGWIVKMGSDPKQVLWAIVPEGNDDVPIGSTGLHGLDWSHSCTSGIIIFDPAWWNRGVASRAHIGRTWYAARRLDRATIRSEVMSPNVASRRALERVGYTVTGSFPNVQLTKEGVFVPRLGLTWYNPPWMPRLFPEGVPSELKDGIERAKIALQRAEEVINFP